VIVTGWTATGDRGGLPASGLVIGGRRRMLYVTGGKSE
jgi:hypothetical protein